jgi:hypothetical protein
VAERTQWNGLPIHGHDLKGRSFEHPRYGTLFVHELMDQGWYDESWVWLCENKDGKAELWRSCDLTRITRRGQWRNKLAYGAYRYYAGGPEHIKEHLEEMRRDADAWLAAIKDGRGETFWDDYDAVVEKSPELEGTI